MSFLFLFVGIVCLLFLQWMRAALALEFPLTRAEKTDEPRLEDIGGYDLFIKAHASLRALGFEGPVWTEDVADPDQNGFLRFRAAYHDPARGIVMWLGPVIELANPSLLHMYLATALDDGRYAVTQVVDPYFTIVDDQKTVAQTVALAPIRELVDRHEQMLSDRDLKATDDGLHEGDILHFPNHHMNALTKRLLERGDLNRICGVARPSWKLALKIVYALLTKPKVKSDKEPVPTIRLFRLFQVATSLSKRVPTRSAQWSLFLLSAALFIVIGWPFFGVQLTLILLAVIVFHEAGHWAAMRAYGYRNPHITLLPLLGGVTIGHETDPSAAKRAWVSLAGPIPGVILGWAILITIAITGRIAQEGSSDWLFMTAIILLAVNYLNVLPIPPLDGSHVLRALIPPKWVSIHALVLLIGTVVGIYVAYLLDFWALALIALLQLLPLRRIWRDGELVRRFSDDDALASKDETEQMTAVLAVLEKTDGVATEAARRIGQAALIINHLKMDSMGRGQRTAVSVVFSVLMIVPVAALVFFGVSRTESDVSTDLDADPWIAEYEQVHQDFETMAQGMPLEELVTELMQLHGGNPQAPAASAAITATEGRIGQTLPDDLTALYAISNGYDAIGIGPLETLRKFSRDDLNSVFETLADGGEIELVSESGDYLTVRTDAIDHWLRVGGDSEEQIVLVPVGDGYTIYVLRPYFAQAFRDISSYLRDSWTQLNAWQAYDEIVEARSKEEAARLSDHSIEQLLEEFQKPSLLERLMNSGAIGSPASEEDIRLLESRLPAKLPDDHRRALRTYNGFAAATLLSTSEIRRVRAEYLPSIEPYLMSADRYSPSESDLLACWAVAGTVLIDGEVPDLYPHVIWCPQAGKPQRYWSLHTGDSYETLTDVLRSQLASTYAGF